MADELETIKTGKPVRKPIAWTAIGRGLLCLSAAACVAMIGVFMASMHRYGFAVWSAVIVWQCVKRAKK